MEECGLVAGWFKANLLWFLWAALLLPWVDGIAVPFNPRRGEAF
jgi:hypothetical protein